MQNSSPDIHDALRLHQAGELGQAAAIYGQVLSNDPRNADALHLLGVVAFQQGAHQKAIESIQQAIDVSPNSAVYHNNLGAAQRELALLDAAIGSFERAAELDANYIEARFNLGNALQAAGRLGDAVTAYRSVLQVQPEHLNALNNLGAALQTQGDLAGATDCYQRVLALDETNADSWHNFGLCLDAQDRLTEAEECFRRALSCRPQFPDAFNSLGSALRIQGRVDEARVCFEQVLTLDPRHHLAQSNVLMTLDYATDVSPQEIHERRCQWGDNVATQIAPQQTHHSSEINGGIIKIGYISPDFREHAVASFIEPILANHSSEFEVVCYADVAVPDRMTQHLQSLVGTWRNIYGMSDEQVAQQVAADRIDILVDLAGHTARHRLRVFARKPAPIQVNYLGDSTTTGLATMDYRISDAWADPWFSDEYCRETLVRLPGGFLCFAPPTAAPEVAALPCTRNGYVTFGSFNSLAKITPAVMRIWAELLQQVPESRLCLKNGALRDESVRTRMTQRFAELEIPAHRLKLLGHVEDATEHLALYNRIDIGLDTFPYGGTTTTCEALWMGVPVVTLSGATHVSRVGTSLLSQLGLNKLVAHDEAEYVHIAGELARDEQRLTILRNGLRDAMLRSSLCDAAGFTHRLEMAYQSMWQQWCASCASEPIVCAG